jgi:hypothetical protein
MSIFSSRNKETQRFYLFAGMGGSAARRKHRRILWWSIAAGILVSAVVAGVIIWINRSAK